MLSYYTVSFSSKRNLHSHLPFHFLSDWRPNPNAKKDKMRKVSPFPIPFPSQYTLSQQYTCFNFLYYSFLIIWKDLKELLLVLIIFALQQKNMQKIKKRYNLMMKSLLSHNTSNGFKFIMRSTRWKNLWPLTRK